MGRTSPPYVDMLYKLEMAVHSMLQRSLAQQIRYVAVSVLVLH